MNWRNFIAYPIRIWLASLAGATSFLLTIALIMAAIYHYHGHPFSVIAGSFSNLVSAILFFAFGGPAVYAIGKAALNLVGVPGKVSAASNVFFNYLSGHLLISLPFIIPGVIAKAQTGQSMISMMAAGLIMVISLSIGAYFFTKVLLYRHPKASI